MTNEHTVRSFDEELNRLDNEIAEMGGLAEHQLAEAIIAFTRRDVELAARVAGADIAVDRLEEQIDHRAVTLLALRQPMAADLRVVISALKTAAILERVGDYAKNVAKRTSALAELPPMPPASSIARLGGLVQNMLKDVLDAYGSRDVDKAAQVCVRDEEVDALYTSLFRELLTYMMEDARNITPGTHLLFIAKNLERVGDHATNIAENIIFAARGRQSHVDRPKGDQSSYTVLTPASQGRTERRTIP